MTAASKRRRSSGARAARFALHPAPTMAVVAAAFVFPRFAIAETDAMHAAHAKTQAKLEAIAASVRGDFGVVVEDLRGEHRFAVNENGVFPQASAIKIPILMELLRQAHVGKLDLETRLTIDAASKTPGSGVLFELSDGGSELSLADLAVVMIVLSDNTATNLLIDAVGMDAVNATMASLGLEQTRLRRRMMDTAAADRGEENTSSPAEAARIMRLLAEGKFIDRGLCDRALAILRKPKRGAVGASLPAEIAVAFKPGAIPGVATEWALVELKNRPYIVAVMGNFGNDAELEGSLRDVGAVAYDFFRRIAVATPYGSYSTPP